MIDPSQKPTALSLPPRLTWLALCSLVAMAYLPINRWMTGGITMETWLDRYIPFWPIWIVPYLLAIGWWLVAGLWAAWKMEDRLMEAFIARWLTACGIGFAIFLMFPTYMVRPPVTEDGWAARLIGYVFSNDRLYNAFPSMHLWTTATITLSFGEWKPRWRGMWWGIVGVVVLATVFTHQHWLLDPFGGILLAVISYFLGPALVSRLMAVRHGLSVGMR
jgi:hypothetical protein